MNADSAGIAASPAVAVTMGDPAGIGPELCLELLAQSSGSGDSPVVVFGDAGILKKVAGRVGLAEPRAVQTFPEWHSSESVPAGSLVVDCGLVEADDIVPGQLSAACGRASFGYVEAAVDAALAGRVLGVATCPVNKEAWRLGGVDFPGHTEAVAALTQAPRVCMLLYAESIACSFVTTHTAYASVPAKLTVDRVVDVIALTADALRRLKDREVRLVVCGLNPHAGEHGLFGREEIDVIGPAIERSRERGIQVEGPVSPDAAFIASQRAKTDGFVCMYHDQGHIPFKMLAFDTGVNISLGLPIVRTSVDHGTAFDIAWTGKASAVSLREAVSCARRLATLRSVVRP